MTHRASKSYRIPFLLFAVLAARGVGADSAGRFKTLERVFAGTMAVAGPGAREMNPDAKISISVVLPLREDLDLFLKQVYDPDSPHFRKFITPDQFKERFGATQGQLNHVSKYLRSFGFRVETISKNGFIIKAQGRVGQVNAAFHTKIYSVGGLGATGGVSIFAPEQELSVPVDLPIQAVLGVENIVRARPHYQIRDVQRVLPSRTIGNGPYGGLTPNDIRKAYHFSLPLDGQGQRLALFELDGFDHFDIDFYAKYFHLRDIPLKTIVVDHASTKPGPQAAEVTLDIELINAITQGAEKILVYTGPNTAQGIVDTYDKIACDNSAKSISTSWGLPEKAAPPALSFTENNLFKQMAAQGQTVFAASGDYGAMDDGVHLSVDDPASQPFVMGVGGTKLQLNEDGSYLGETTWNKDNTPKGGASGGGISHVWKIPKWQVPAITKTSLASETYRNVPDVALNADPATGYSIYFNHGWIVVGGTSCAAPIWAAFSSLIDQERSKNRLGPVGFLGPSIYHFGLSRFNAVVFHDIQDGSNNIKYPAEPGLDNATGWGSLDADYLLQILFYL
jgi:kumamolisin